MKPIIKFSALFFMIGFLFHLSCKKELSCENCNDKNKPPIANAGRDTIIILPADSILLDGSLSTDPDGTIVNYKWIKISGPLSSNILRTDSSKTLVKTLVIGVYSFELTVTDNGGLSAKDTVQIIVNDPAQPNQPPVANAGKDTTITLPANIITLDGNGSTDPDNNITTYLWTKISGPSSFNISNANAVQTQVTSLAQGVYQFELKVTDNGGLSARDTIKIVVDTVISSASCLPVNRPIINAQLTPVGTLSEARTYISVASAGNKILFAGGMTSSRTPLSTVDIYDITTQQWSIAQLSIPRVGMAAISVGNKIYFAGGRSTNVDTPSSRIDIYDAVSNSWTTAQLSEPRSDIAVATIGNKIFFAGGAKLFTCSICTSDKVDIYDITTNSWSVKSLSIAREGMSATVAGNKIYFAGGNELWGGINGSGVFDQIDIYDNTTNAWSTSTLYEKKGHPGSIAIGNYIYWAGGEIVNNSNDYETTCNVEKRDLVNGTSTIVHLFQPSYANSNAQPSMNILLKNGSFVFYTGTYQFDIYNPLTDVWSIGVMNQGFDFAGVISVNNIIYIAGGGFPSYTPSSNQVFKLEF